MDKVVTVTTGYVGPASGGAASLPPGQPGQLLGYGPDGAPVAVDTPEGGAVYDDSAIRAEVQAVAAAVAAIPAPVTSLAWTAIEGKPASYPPAAHGHAWSDLTGIPATFAPSAHTHAWSEVTGKPAFAAVATSGAYGDLTGAPTFKTINGTPITGSGNISITAGGASYDDTALSGRVAALEGKTYATVATTGKYSDLSGIPSTFAPAAHGHAISDVTGLQSALDGKAAASHTHAWADVTGKPATFAPAAHTHAIADMTGLQAALDGKQPTTTFKTVNGQDITGTGDIAIPKGADGKSWTVTVVTSQAAYDAATPAANELVVRV